MYIRKNIQHILPRFIEPRRFIQVLSGPRQVGKTTLAHQVTKELNIPVHYASADDPALRSHSWIEQQWNTARTLVKVKADAAILILDEAQKLSGWDEVVKKLWDEDTKNRLSLHTLLLGSSPLLLQTGLSESLTGRFEIIPITHWSYTEMKDAFDYSFEEYIFFGGYPGAAPIRNDEERWKNYIRNSLIETTIARDLLLLSKIDKPALLRRLFDLGCSYSGQELSFQKMVGQLQDAGNTTTLANYLTLLSQVGLVTGLEKYAGQVVRKRASSPKFQILNTALISSGLDRTFEDVQEDSELWGRLVESAIGAHLLNSASSGAYKVYYWRDGKHEVDFVLEKGKKLVAIEVKSSKVRKRPVGLDQFSVAFGDVKKILIGKGGIALEDFLQSQPEELF